MAKAKKTATRRAAKSEDEAVLVQVPPGFSPVAAEALNIRLNGGVIDNNAGDSEEAMAYRRSGRDLVTVPRLDKTIMDPVLGRVYPSEKPVQISYSAAVTFGLLNVDLNNPPPAIRQQSVVTEPSSGGTPAEDNGHGGTGNASGYEQPAHDLAAQPPTLDEIDAAAEAAGLSNEQVATED